MIPWEFRDPIPLMGAWTLEESERFCMNVTLSHYENFPVVGGVLGRGARRSLAAVYGFARQADDFADEPAFEGVRLELLDAWERQLRSCARGEGQRHPVFIALAAAFERHGLEEAPFLDLLSAFRQDCTKQRYATFEELLDYCRRSANPVGRIVLRVMKRDNPRTVELSDGTCTALQLINFWQDLSVDIARGRLYVPEDIARWHGVSLEALLEGWEEGSFGALLDDLVGRTREMMREASALPEAVGLPGGLFLRAVQAGGLSMLEAVSRMGEGVLSRRPSLSGVDKGIIFVRSAGGVVGGLLRGGEE
jgi:squalene synthase HpnC